MPDARTENSLGDIADDDANDDANVDDLNCVLNERRPSFSLIASEIELIGEMLLFVCSRNVSEEIRSSFCLERPL